jgi:hypothetical protein
VEGLWHGSATSSGAWTSARWPHWQGVDHKVARFGSISTADSELRWVAALDGDGNTPTGCTWERGGVSGGGQHRTIAAAVAHRRWGGGVFVSTRDGSSDRWEKDGAMVGSSSVSSCTYTWRRKG